ncbi:hypothetical protein [Polaribacter sp. KT 15]|uniref:hypothetical protein n=1 Tax=Polaribacter sp. KT 15 TaxID=1896175 RepID=UPI00090A20B1|nr:hypothetical protein [Polaribacter sp. KT 15]SHM68942.1 hypothetical protein SAMN05720268_0029 [Polaribacter sp. KT 15]
MSKNYILIAPLLLLLVAMQSCTNSGNNTNTYFGGKIINPKTKFVVLYANDKLIDTLDLDNKNKFLGTFNNLDEGLYYFKHGNENQYIYLEPKDSLMLRLNTWDFDESLVFAGKGAERNNILIDIFLEDENERKLFYKLNRLSPNKYQEKVDSIIDVRLETYKEYIEKHPNETDSYFKILKTALTYTIYSRAERYPTNHVYSLRKKDFPEINSSFYDYRKNIEYNNNDLMYYTPYARYITNYLYNKTYALGHKPKQDSFTTAFTVDLLNTIDKEINSKDSKNALLKRTVLDHFYRKSSCNINNESFELFFKLSTNKDDIRLVKNVLEDNKVIHKGDKVKGFSIFDFTNQSIDITDFTKNKNSVLLFWNKEYMSKSFLSSRIPYLQKKFPNLNFAVIEVDGNNNNRIKNIDIKNQYYINSKDLKENFLTSKMNRTILVNKNGIVTNGYAAISSYNINNQLKELSKNN